MGDSTNHRPLNLSWQIAVLRTTFRPQFDVRAETEFASALLKERFSALIAAALTGQLEPGEQAA